MSFSFISRCGSCTSQDNYENACSDPLTTPQGCYQRMYTSESCEPDYEIKCDYDIDSNRVQLCCPVPRSYENMLDVTCTGNLCDMKIAFGNKKMECASKQSLVECLNDPTTTYVDKIADEYPVPWLVNPTEIYQTLRSVSSDCGGSSDYECLPYSDVYETSNLSEKIGRCPSGKLNNYSYYNPTTSCDDLRSSELCEQVSSSVCREGYSKIDHCSSESGSILCCDLPDPCYTLGNLTTANTKEKNVYCELVCPSYKDQVKILGNNNSASCDYSYYNLCKMSGCKPDPKCEIQWLPYNNKRMPNKLPSIRKI